MEPTPQQHAIFEAVLHTTHHVIVDASAGSGKTTTLEMLAKRLPKSKISLFLAFNKNIAGELVKRLPYWCPAKTFHSHCFSAMRLGMTKVPTLDADKTRKILFDIVGEDKEEFFLYLPFVKKLVSLAKGQATTDPVWDDLIDYHDILCEGNVEKGIQYAAKTLARSNESFATIDFDDMLYLTWLLNLPFQKADYLFIDEAQDLNTIQHALLPSMIKPTGQIVAVGDPYQSIYAFRGADSDSMSKLQKQFNMLELPLSVSYRCPKNVVASARHVITQWLNHGTITNKYEQKVEITTVIEPEEYCRNCGEIAEACDCKTYLSSNE